MDSKKIKILAIDDNEDNLIILKALIKESFPAVLTSTALTGTKGLELAAAKDPDVILLDIVMPGMDGFEICQKLKADKNLSDIPVVFITALKGDKESRIRALEAGAEAFLTKPIDASELTAQICAMVKIKNANIEKRNEKKRLTSLVDEQTRELTKTHIATLNLLEDVTRENEARKKSEEALRDSEEKYRLLVNTADESVVVVQDDLFKFINPKMLSLLQGYSEKEIMDRPFSEFIHPVDRSMVVENHRRRIAKETIPTRYAFRVVTRDRIVKWVEISVALIEWQGKPATLCFLTDITERKQAEQFLRESQEQLKAFAGHLHSVREEERLGIARELHDNLGQNLSAIKMDICMVIKKLDDLKGIKTVGAVIQLASNMIPMIEMTINQVRKISGELRPHLLEELGLIAAIEKHVEEFGKRSGISCQLVAQVRKIKVERKYAVGIFRILQEALTNVMRHANASSVFVRILKSKGAIVMEIEDNGIGIKASRINSIKSIGILGMRERAMLVGGELMISTRKGKGTKITLTIPIKTGRR